MIASFLECCETLSNNGVVAIHTETVYGLAANALSEGAVRKIYELKGRPKQNPLIVHIFSSQDAYKIAHTTSIFYKLSERFWPGPLSFVLPARENIPLLTRAGLPTVALRSPQSKVFRKTLESTGLFLAAPSANPSNRISPTNADHVIDGFKDNCPQILDGGDCHVGIESTVLDLTTNNPTILRPGPVGKAALENHLGIKVNSMPSEDLFLKKSPGMTSLHYAPLTPTFIFKDFKSLASRMIERNQVVLLPFKSFESKILRKEKVFSFADSNSLLEVSRKLYSKLHFVDKMKASSILTCLFPENDQLAVAINDRLRRTGKLICE